MSKRAKALILLIIGSTLMGWGCHAQSIYPLSLPACLVGVGLLGVALFIFNDEYSKK
jgi:hypothetical protein